MSRLERIAAAWGGLVYDNGRRALVRGPDHGWADRSVSLVETEDGRILIHCFSPKDDWRAVRDALRAQRLLDEVVQQTASSHRKENPTVVVQPGTEERQVRAVRFWNESRSLRCTPASAYLKRRHIEAAESAELRFHPRMSSVDDRLRRPALVAAIRGSDGVLQGVQATLLTPYGADKARVSTPRRVIGKLLGGAVQLAPARDALIIAEGVESALSAACELEAPAWAALTAYNLSQFAPPESVSCLIAAPDNDAAGLRALDVLCARLAGRLQIEHAPPPAGLNDWNDWARVRAKPELGSS
ncbi:MAG: toprim domain-containing protein [Hyphomonadaceae bacterium]|nr:toprim domain-containing protein [Hyphomonadaceae bacterium]